jgi:hypothetical protein
MILGLFGYFSSPVSRANPLMNPFSLYSSLVLLVLILSACDQSYQHQSQVLATVNDDEISLH